MLRMSFIRNFNPTLVQLELSYAADIDGNPTYFNPTLVQLE